MLTVPLNLTIDEKSELWLALRPHACNDPQQLFKNAAYLYAMLLERAAGLGVTEVTTQEGFQSFCVTVLDAVDDYVSQLDADARHATMAEPDITLTEIEEAAFLTHARAERGNHED